MYGLRGMGDVDCTTIRALQAAGVPAPQVKYLPGPMPIPDPDSVRQFQTWIDCAVPPTSTTNTPAPAPAPTPSVLYPLKVTGWEGTPDSTWFGFPPWVILAGGAAAAFMLFGGGRGR